MIGLENHCACAYTRVGRGLEPLSCFGGRMRSFRIGGASMYASP